MSNFHKVNISSPDITGMGTVIQLDGVELKGVRQIGLFIGTNEPTVLRLELLVDGVNVEAVADSVIKSSAVADL